MAISERLKSQRGATQLGIMDVLAALILLGILLFAAYLQFPVYQQAAVPSPTPSGAEQPAPK